LLQKKVEVLFCKKAGMKRDIITIDREKCNGCGQCVSGCHEGAIQLIDGKAVLVSELMCDGLGACIGECPEGAITVERREAEAYDEVTTLSQMVTSGKNTTVAHLKHLKEYQQSDYLRQAVEWLLTNREKVSFSIDEVLQEVHSHSGSKCGFGNGLTTEKAKQPHQGEHGGGCPGSVERNFRHDFHKVAENTLTGKSELTHWPVQLHLINPNSEHFKGSNLLLAADCVAYSLGNFHSQYLSGKTLAIACPKLDSNKEVYVEKITSLIDDAQVDTITVMKMEVPCCGGLLQIAKMAREKAKRRVPLKVITVGIQGEILDSLWEN
jgi:ferredoxin